MKKIWNKLRLSDKILVSLVTLIVIGLSAATIHANITNRNANENPQVEVIETQTSDMLTVVEAREIAIELVGGGTVNELNLNTDEVKFDIIVYYNEAFQVTLNAKNGELIRLESLTAPSNIVELSETAPLSGNLTAEQAVDIAKQHLASIGITNATLFYSYSDIEGGIPVWSIEFKYNGRGLEFYVVKATGDLLKYPMASNNSSAGGNTGSAPIPLPSVPTSSSSTHSTLTEISRERAGEIALVIAPGRIVEISRDWENGRPAWWVEIRHEGMIHEFYIDMETGTILQHEVERDD